MVSCYDAANLFMGIPVLNMTAVFSLDAHWQPGTRVLSPAALSPWLLEPASLTARLKARSERFRLQLLAESTQVLPDFLKPCFAQRVSDCVCREVLMWCNDMPAVYAQSWLPLQSVKQINALTALGEQPLGELLFQFPDVERSPIEIAQLGLVNSIAPISAGEYWARRSVFSVAKQPLLVAEVFLPGVLQL